MFFVTFLRWIPFFLVFAYPQLVDGVSKTGTFLALVRLPFLLASLCLGGFLAALPTSNISAVLLNVNCPRVRNGGNRDFSSGCRTSCTDGFSGKDVRIASRG